MSRSVTTFSDVNCLGDLNWNDDSMDFPYGFWAQEADPWLPELDFFAMEAEPQVRSIVFTVYNIGNLYYQ
ncbi:hypothetical protein LTR22_023149 [Elasticomyces elasticus]|nr:hypothetical protein LTR22_023149 [Elasticomyces elasticus]